LTADKVAAPVTTSARPQRSISLTSWRSQKIQACKARAAPRGAPARCVPVGGQLRALLPTQQQSRPGVIRHPTVQQKTAVDSTGGTRRGPRHWREGRSRPSRRQQDFIPSGIEATT
jgi:hypothetical protein